MTNRSKDDYQDLEERRSSLRDLRDKPTINLNLEDSKVKITERSRGRMKITVKLSAEEAVAFKNFSQIKPPEVEDETFWKQIFLTGCNAMSMHLQELVAQHKGSLEAQKQAALDAVVPDDQIEITPPADETPADETPTETV